MMTRFSAALVAAVLTTLPAAAGAADGLSVENAWSRPNLPDRPAAAYMTLGNSGNEAARLVAASSPAFERVELHTTREEDGVMKMIALDSVAVPAGGTVAFEPGGNHLMLFGAERLFEEGERYTVTLEFEGGEEMTVTVAVARRGGMDHGNMDHGKMDHGKMDHGNMDHGDGMDMDPATD